MRKILPFYLLVFFVFFLLNQSVIAENLHFNDSVFELKYTDNPTRSKIIKNEYYKANENRDYWTNMIEISYFPDVDSPRKYAVEIDKKIESNENCILLKYLQNKKRDIALISYLENVVQNDKPFFIYNLYKYEKHPKKGMMVLRYAKKYIFNSNDEINNIGKDVKMINNDLMEQLIISPIPPIVSKDHITLTK